MLVSICNKKEKNEYITYVFKTDEAKLDVFEDFAEEKVRSFDDLE
jgi:hypothetical protein